MLCWKPALFSQRNARRRIHRCPHYCPKDGGLVWASVRDSAHRGGCLFNAYSSLEELSDCSNIQRVVEYSRGSNRIIEIVEVDASRQMISTHYHADMFPLLVICQNEFLFSERRKEILQERYLDLLQSISKMQALYDQIVDELELLIRSTGAYFSDFSGNNLIANDDFSDFRIIDVGSLTDFSNPITFSAQDLFLGRKFETERYAVDNILRAFQRYPSFDNIFSRKLERSRSEPSVATNFLKDLSWQK